MGIESTPPSGTTYEEITSPRSTSAPSATASAPDIAPAPATASAPPIAPAPATAAIRPRSISSGIYDTLCSTTSFYIFAFIYIGFSLIYLVPIVMFWKDWLRKNNFTSSNSSD